MAMAVAVAVEVASEHLKVSKEDPKIDDMEIETLTPRTSNEGSIRKNRIYYVERFLEYHVPLLKEAWPLVGQALKEHGIFCFINLSKQYIKIRTTRKTKDPDMIERAREFILLLARTRVPPSTCVQILNGDLHHEYIKTWFQRDGLATIHGISKEQFHKQRKSLKAHRKKLERLLDCQIYVNGNSATLVSTSLGSVKTAKKAVQRCFLENVNAADLVKMMKASFAQQRKLDRKLERKLEGLRI